MSLKQQLSQQELTEAMETALSLRWRGLPAVAMNPKTASGLKKRGYLDDLGELTEKANQWAEAQGLTECDKGDPAWLMLDSLPVRQLRGIYTLMESRYLTRYGANLDYLIKKELVDRVGLGDYTVLPPYREAWPQWKAANPGRIAEACADIPVTKPEPIISRPPATLSALLGSEGMRLFGQLGAKEKSTIRRRFNSDYTDHNTPEVRREIMLYMNACVNDRPMIRRVG